MQVLRRGTLSNWQTHMNTPRDTTRRCLINKQDPNSLIFFRGTLGKFVTCPIWLSAFDAGTAGHYVISDNTDPIDFAEVVPSSFFAKGLNNYGVEIYDASGALTFTSARDFVARGSYFLRQFTTNVGEYVYPTQTADEEAQYDWWCPLGKSRGVVRYPAGSPTGSNSFRDYFAAAVRRETTTRYRAGWLVHKISTNNGSQSTPVSSYGQVNWITGRDF